MSTPAASWSIAGSLSTGMSVWIVDLNAAMSSGSFGMSVLTSTWSLSEKSTRCWRAARS